MNKSNKSIPLMKIIQFPKNLKRLKTRLLTAKILIFKNKMKAFQSKILEIKRFNKLIVKMIKTT